MIRRIGVAVLASVSCWAFAQTDGAARTAQLKVGDEWVYGVNQRAENQVFDETVTLLAIEGGQFRTRHVRAEPHQAPVEREGLHTLEWAQVVNGVTGSRYEPPLPLMKFPLTVGDTWKSAYEVTTPRGVKSRSELAFKVVAAEKLDTPAGAFDTFKVEATGFLNGVTWRGTLRLEQTMWFAPAIHRWVRFDYKDFRDGKPNSSTLSELKAFKPAP